MSSTNPFDIEGSCVNIEMMNPNLSYKSLKSGDRFLLTVEIKKETWEQLQECSSRAGMILDADVTIAALNESLGDKPKKEHHAASPANMLHTTFLGTAAFHGFVAEISNEYIANEDDCKAALKRYMNIGSLSEISIETMTTLMSVYRGYCVRNSITTQDG